MKHLKFLFFAGLLVFSCFSSFFGQMARKPSAMKVRERVAPNPANSPDRSLPAINSQADFDSVARVYHQGTPFVMPHTMFVIDRKDKNKIYYVNSQKFRFHKDFLLATYLIPRGGDVFKPIYLDEDRRFIVGTVAWQKPVEKFTWELWEGDLASGEIIKLAHDVINKTFFQTVSFKPNSLRQEDASVSLSIPRVLQSDIAKEQEYLPLNTGKAIGRIHIIEKLDDTVEIGDNEILILKELPLSLPPVRGIIVAKPSTPLSHINILAHGWGIPNVYIKNADIFFKELDNRWIELDASLTDFKYKLAGIPELNKPEAKSPDIQTAPVNLNVKKIASLREMRQKDSIVYGSKSANLGEMLNSRLVGVVVPNGFTVPFYWYDKFMKENGFDKDIEQFLDDNDFVHNPRIRRERLDQFRKKIQQGKFDETLKREIVRKWKTELGGQPVFVRSSSNSEDLPNFSGAGLYSSKANLIDEKQIIDGVKYVWASLWNFDAYEARVRNYVDQQSVYMSALIQTGVNMDRGGVMITKDPFDPDNKNAVYISAVCGHNSKIPNNEGIPEQILFNPKSNSVVVMTLSQQQNALTFDERGDLKETPDVCSKQNRILSNLQARNLAKTALSIRRIFGNKKEQDIEWGIMKGKLYVVQARPYIDKK